MTTPQSEVIFEQVRIGSLVRVTAIDAATGTEVVTQGPASARPHELQRLALAKLAYVLKKKSGNAT
jgi:hypothetical protein